jgi:YggT family protein
MAISQAGAFLVQTLLGLFSLVFLLRFVLQACRAPFRESFCVAVMRLSDFAVLPVRKVIPAMLRWDSASLLLALLCEYLIQVLMRWLNDFPLLVAGQHIWLGFLGLAAVALLKLAIDIFLYAVIVQALLSWFNPSMAYHPVLNALTAPVLNRLRKLIPQPSGVDLTPILVVILAQLLKILLISPLNAALLGWI